MVMILDIAVREIESAVSHLPRKAIRLEVGPPGQAAIKIRPIANSGFRSIEYTKPKAMAGNKINCENKPVNTALGKIKILLKSSMLRVRPIPYMMVASASGSSISMSKLVSKFVFWVKYTQCFNYPGFWGFSCRCSVLSNT